MGAGERGINSADSHNSTIQNSRKKPGDEPTASLKGMATHGLTQATGGNVTTEPFKNDKYVNYVDMREDINRVYYGLDFLQP